MQLKIKKGIELLDTYGDSKISVYNDSICVNFKQRYTYSHLTQKGKTITIYVKDDPTEDNSTLSMIKLVFAKYLRFRHCVGLQIPGKATVMNVLSHLYKLQHQNVG